MIPTDDRLIDGVRRALATFAGPDRSAEDRRRVVAIEIALNELSLRQDKAFFAKLVDEGQRLLATATRLLGVDAPVASAGVTLTELMAPLATATTALSARKSDGPSVKAFLTQVVDWENALHARRLQTSAPVIDAPERGGGFSAEAIEQYLQTRGPQWRQTRVTKVQQLSGGFSKLTVLLDIESPGQGKQSLVIRAEQPLTIIFLEGADISNEYHVIRVAAAAGIPVVDPLWLEEDAKALGARFMVVRHAPGRNFGSRIDVNDSISDGLLRDILRRLVQIHSVRLDTNASDVAESHLGRLLRFSTLQESVSHQIEFWREKSANFGIPRAPILARALAWLQSHVPTNSSPPVFLHGDYGLHNVLIGDDDRVSCILDWEGASVGDPADDLIWLTEGLKATVDRARILDLYQEYGGQAISEERLRYFEVMNCVRFAVTCPRALHLFQEYPTASIDACQLGFLYMYHGTSSLNRAIELAEAAAKAGRSS